MWQFLHVFLVDLSVNRTEAPVAADFGSLWNVNTPPRRTVHVWVQFFLKPETNHHYLITKPQRASGEMTQDTKLCWETSVKKRAQREIQLTLLSCRSQRLLFCWGFLLSLSSAPKKSKIYDAISYLKAIMKSKSNSWSLIMQKYEGHTMTKMKMLITNFILKPCELITGHVMRNPALNSSLSQSRCIKSESSLLQLFCIHETNR